MNIEEQLLYLKKGTVDFIREEDLKAKLRQSAKTGKTSACKVLKNVSPKKNRLRCTRFFIRSCRAMIQSRFEQMLNSAEPTKNLIF
jgi:hypothetical protein